MPWRVPASAGNGEDAESGTVEEIGHWAFNAEAQSGGGGAEFFEREMSPPRFFSILLAFFPEFTRTLVDSAR